MNKSIGFAGLLALLFIGLKLGNVIEWSWLWVLSPLWLPWAVVGGVLMGIAFVVIVPIGIVWLMERVSNHGSGMDR